MSIQQDVDPMLHELVAVSRLEIGDLVRQYFSFVWRLLRRMGLSETDADDGAQQVFIIASSRLADIWPGRERPFLFGVAINVAKKVRHAHLRAAAPLSEVELEDRGSHLDELLDQKRARSILDDILGSMPDELRVVFTLYEIEELTTPEIAGLLEIPTGTVASRLRRARHEFDTRVARLEAQQSRRRVRR